MLRVRSRTAAVMAPERRRAAAALAPGRAAEDALKDAGRFTRASSIRGGWTCLAASAAADTPARPQASNQADNTHFAPPGSTNTDFFIARSPFRTRNPYRVEGTSTAIPSASRTILPQLVPESRGSDAASPDEIGASRNNTSSCDGTVASSSPPVLPRVHLRHTLGTTPGSGPASPLPALHADGADSERGLTRRKTARGGSPIIPP